MAKRSADKGVGHRYIKPRTPRLNGKLERSHRIDADEFYRLPDGTVVDDANVFAHKLREWEDYSNYHRPRRPDPLRTTTTQDQDPDVKRHRQLHT